MSVTVQLLLQAPCDLQVSFIIKGKLDTIDLWNHLSSTDAHTNPEAFKRTNNSRILGWVDGHGSDDQLDILGDSPKNSVS